MAVVRPFRAVRPKKEFVEKIISLPYDVMNREEAEEMAEGNPLNFLHVVRSEIDLPGVDAYDPKVYQKAKENLDNYKKEGQMFQEDKPTLYIYREWMGDHCQTGVVGCVAVDDYKNEVIKRHELTRADKEQDRINHIDITGANTGQVFLTYPDNMKIKTLTEGYLSNNDPEYDLMGPNDVRHQVWVINDDSLVKALCEIFADIPALYIADGHHRSASSYKVGLKRREENPGYTGDEEFNYFMATILPAGDLKCYDYNRVVADLNGNDKDAFIDKVKAAGFEVEEMGTEAYRPAKLHEFGMYMDNKWYKMTAKDSIIPGDVIGALDVSILQENVLNPILGIENPRTDERIDFVGGIRGLDELKKRADSDMKLAFAVFPLPVDELFKVADGKLEMPPKSTWFEPKLGSGLLIHEL